MINEMYNMYPSSERKWIDWNNSVFVIFVFIAEGIIISGKGP